MADSEHSDQNYDDDGKNVNQVADGGADTLVKSDEKTHEEVGQNALERSDFGPNVKEEVGGKNVSMGSDNSNRSSTGSIQALQDANTTQHGNPELVGSKRGRKRRHMTASNENTCQQVNHR